MTGSWLVNRLGIPPPPPKTNIAMEHPPFEDAFPIEHKDVSGGVMPVKLGSRMLRQNLSDESFPAR